jgi:peptide/nickel transport system permease protein
MTFVLRRAGQAAIVLIAAFTATFFLLQLLPGDAILIKFADPSLGLSPDQLDSIRTTYGADLPWWEQYVHAGLGFLAGDFGFSTQFGTPVLTMLAEALPATLLLASLGLVVALLLAVLIAGLSSLAPFAWLRDGLRQVPGLFVAVPVFWLGILLIQAQPFVTVVRAKGAPPLWVLTRSVARNAAVPTLTIAGVLFGELVGGAVVTETVFGRTGIGRLTEQAVANQDIPVLQGVVLLSALGFVIISFAVDLVTPLIDPRQRTVARSTGPRATRRAPQEVAA